MALLLLLLLLMMAMVVLVLLVVLVYSGTSAGDIDSTVAAGAQSTRRLRAYFLLCRRCGHAVAVRDTVHERTCNDAHQTDYCCFVVRFYFYFYLYSLRVRAFRFIRTTVKR